MALFSVLFSIWITPTLPDKLVTHWDLNNSANGFAEKSTIVWLSLLPLAMVVLFYAMPAFDPLWKKYGEKAREKYWFLTLILSIFFFLVVLLTILANLGCVFNMGQAVSALIGFLFFGMGYYFVDCKPSWFVGIRTPWTLMSEDNWTKTHEMASSMFYLLGSMFIIGAIVLPTVLLFVLIMAIAGSLALVGYSYILYRQEKKTKKSEAAAFAVLLKPAHKAGKPKAAKKK
ncbi:MAG: SdpI family protein [Candidatus Micrarchaeia archaeon]